MDPKHSIIKGMHLYTKIIPVDLFVCFDALHPNKQFFSHVGMDLPGFVLDRVSCSKTQHNDSNKQPFNPQSKALPSEPLNAPLIPVEI